MCGSLAGVHLSGSSVVLACGPSDIDLSPQACIAAVLQSDMYVTVWTMQLQMCNQPALPNAAAVRPGWQPSWHARNSAVVEHVLLWVDTQDVGAVQCPADCLTPS
jgi:hypothetical protein